MNELPVCHLSLADGRNLSYTDVGSGVNGTWIHCHGIPGSRHELNHIVEDPSFKGLRVIIPDRPGYGDSTPHPDFCFASHSDDLRQLADHLQLSRFAVSGFSGGGVFAMATAHDLGNRISQLTIAATPAVPLMEDPFKYASKLTANAWLTALENPQALASELQTLTTSSDALSAAMLNAAGESEQRYLLSAPICHSFYTSLHTAIMQGAADAAKALARDTLMIAGRWPFPLEKLKLPTMVTHGCKDRIVHKEHQHALITQLPGAKSCLIDDCGHYGVLHHLWGQT